MSNTKMDEFSALLQVQDIKKKITVGTDILNYIANNENSIECSDIGIFIDNIVPWIQHSNYRVSQNGLEILIQLVKRLGPDFRVYVPTLLGSVIDRLGDGKENVREKCKCLLIVMLQFDTLGPVQMFEKLVPGFSHKNSKVREEMMLFFNVVVNMFGVENLAIGRCIIPHLIKNLSDSHGDVRDLAIYTLVELYKLIGDKLVTDIQKNYKLPPNKMTTLISKFNDVKAEGKVLIVPGAVYYNDEDEPDRSIPKPRKTEKRNVSASATPQQQKPPIASQVASVAGSSIATSKVYGRRSTSVATTAGGVDEESFLAAFEDVPSVPMISHKELESVIKKIKEEISSSSEHWEKKVNGLKKIRAVLLGGAISFDDIHTHIRTLDIPMEAALKDLRSTVVREASITVAFLSRELQNKFDNSAEFLFPALVNLIPNSARVMSTSGLTSIKFILTHTHYSRLIPLIVNNLNSKSRDIRKASCEFLDLILRTWSTHPLERHGALLQEAVKKGLADPEPAARTNSRKAFWGYKRHFPDQAEAILKSLEGRIKQQLLAEAPDSAQSTSTQSATVARTTRQDTTTRRIVPVQAVRSNSAIDLQAAQRARARAQYSALARQKVGASGSMPRTKKIVMPSPLPLAAPAPPSPDRPGRPRSRSSGVSQSQPGSRSGSPSSRVNYATYNVGPELSYGPRSRTFKPFCRSTGTSRETSPNRFSAMQGFGSKLRSRPSGLHDRPPIHSSRPVMAQKILQQSREAESALADALSCDPTEGIETHKVSPKRGSFKSYDEHSDDSETSSICSERSDSMRRPSDSISWSGSQQRLYRDLWEPKTISEIILNCESTHWSDRKEGLVGLQMYFQSGNVLTAQQLKRTTENFTKMFMDSHTKVFSLFLDTLNELILTHRADLNSWLYVLLTRLLNKLGGDLLGSIQTKIHKSLEVVRESFPCEQQMLSVLRFLVDATQTPNARVKTAALNYVTKLAPMTDPQLAFPVSSPGNTKDIPTAAITKMIGWTMGDSIKQGTELRRAAQEAILALFNLNTPQVTMRFSLLPREYQEAAATLIHGRVRRSSIGGGVTTTMRCSPPATPGTQSPPRQRPRFSLQHDAENLNPEEVYKSLRKTTAEIQNYSFESGRGKLTQQITTSQDSGISQTSPVGLEEQMDSLNLRTCLLSATQTASSRTSVNQTSPVDRLDDPIDPFSLHGCLIKGSPSVSSHNTSHEPVNLHHVAQELPVIHTENENYARVLTPRDCNGKGKDTIDSGNLKKDSTFLPSSLQNKDYGESMRKILDSLKPFSEDPLMQSRLPLTEEEKKSALYTLRELVQDASTATLLDHFKSLLRILLGLLSVNSGPIKSLVLVVLSEMLKRRSLTDHFNNYVELLILKMFHIYRDPCKEVQRSAESCIIDMSTLFNPEMVIRVLAPLITTEPIPVNLISIKMLTRLVEARGRHPVQEYLPDLMPGLVQAYDNEDSSVRKSAVFCMVALHIAVGDEALKPYLASLNGSKLKLLNVYIRRAQHSSPPATPRCQGEHSDPSDPS